MCDMPTVYSCDRPTARKEHKCCECRGKISVGEKYHKHHGIWGGEADTFKVCDDCEMLRAECDKGLGGTDDCTAFGELCESVFESDNPSLIKRFMDTKRKREGRIEPWMLERELE